MKILLLVVSCLILHVQAQNEGGVYEQQRDITDPDIPDEEVSSLDEKAIPTVKQSFNYNCACGIANPVVSGAARPLNRYPWALQLTTLAADGINQRFFCGASMISDRYALATASCFDNINKQVYARIVRVVGSQSLGFIRSVTIKKHPAYNSTTKYANLAILKFNETVQPANGIGPICMTRRNYVFRNRTGYTARWGHLTGGLISNSVRINKARIISNAACQKIHPTKRIYKTNMCAGPYVANSNFTCQSDNGGPLSVIDKTIKASGTVVNRHKLAGVGSHGYGCRDPLTAPGVYTPIAPFHNFIYMNTLDSRYCGA